jgi:glycogen debranching enzyme
MTVTAENTEPREAIGQYALKDGGAFLVADSFGDVSGYSDGLFLDDTRILSKYALKIGRRSPSLLSCGVSQDNVFFRAHLTNRPLPELGGHVTPEGVIHIERARLLWRTRLYERLTLTNYGSLDLPTPLSLRFACDFADIFEVRGHARPQRGRMLGSERGERWIAQRYRGLDGKVRACVLAFSERPDRLGDDFADFTLQLAPYTRLTMYVEIGIERADSPSRERFRAAAACARVAMRAKRRRGAALESPGRAFHKWLDKSRSDLALLTTEFATGPYPCAGIPWFAVPFGRDGIITAMQLLWLDPALARGVLRFHALHQARDTSAFQDSAPGKIMHETRNGEMAVLGEVPFQRYYGGVDSTPLFVMLAGAYAQRTADLALIGELWPALEAAMAWIDGAGDSDGDGFIDYQAARSSGLANQGWKDSADSIFHADGTMPRGPIALVEVQGYVYAARRAMAWLAERRNERELAQHWRRRAKQLRSAVEERFWMPDLGYYAIALDGHGAPCRVRASNAGQLLFTRLPAPKRAARVIEQLTSSAFDDGWGIRTLAHGEPRFNPMSYHNGSVWPHDTAICAAGMANYGQRRAAARLVSELFTASAHFDTRLPELYCGFGRRVGEPPVGYPVACLPQAWSSGAIFMMLQACLGITIDAEAETIHIDRPELPGEVERLTVRDIAINGSAIDIAFTRVGERVIGAPVGALPGSVQVILRA